MIAKLTPSRYRDFDICPQRYRLLYATGARAVTVHSPALAFGNSLHAALEELHRPGHTVPQEMSDQDLIQRHWVDKGYSDAKQATEYFNLATWAIHRYREQAKVGGRVLATEQHLSRIVVSEGARFELAGRADRLDLLPDGALRVLDYKTGQDGQVPTAAELQEDPATFIYYLLARLAYPEHPRVVVSQLNVLSLEQVTIDYPDIARLQNKTHLLSVVRAIEAEQWELRMGAHCGWCPVRVRCPAFGQEADISML